MTCNREFYNAGDGTPVAPTRPVAVIVSNAKNPEIFAAARAVNAAAKVAPPICLVYRLGPSVRSDQPATTNPDDSPRVDYLTRQNGVVAWDHAVANGWFALDNNGARMQVSGYPEWLLDFSLPAVVAEAVATCLAVVGDRDGILFDNGWTTYRWADAAWGDNAPPARLPAWLTDPLQWVLREAAYLAQLADALHKAGKLLYVNSGPVPEEFTAGRGAILPFVDGLWDEKSIAGFPADLGQGVPYGYSWRTIHQQQAMLARLGIDSLVSWKLDGNDAHTLAALCSWLLGANGTKSAFGAQVTYGSKGQDPDPLGPARALGDATAKARCDPATGVWSRTFRHGVVLFNPQKTSAGGLAAMAGRIDLS